MNVLEVYHINWTTNPKIYKDISVDITMVMKGCALGDCGNEE